MVGAGTGTGTGTQGGKAAGPSGKPRKPTCFYCERAFDAEEALIQHQKAAHFRCTMCKRAFNSAPAMGVHMTTVHQTELKAVPRAVAGREDPSLEISGMHGVPADAFAPKAVVGGAAKRQRADAAAANASNATIAAPAVASLFPPCEPDKHDGLVWHDDSISPEEARAALPRYVVDEKVVETKLVQVEDSVEARLRRLKEKLGAVAPTT